MKRRDPRPLDLALIRELSFLVLTCLACAGLLTAYLLTR